MPEYFKKHGYLAYGAGKLYHNQGIFQQPPNNDWPTSWTEDDFNPMYWGNNATLDAGFCSPYNPLSLDYPARRWSPLSKSLICRTKESANDDTHFDHRLATRTIETLRHSKQTN